MLTRESVQSILVEVMSNPVLHQLALKACGDLYNEEFIGGGSEWTGQDIIDNGNKDEIIQGLCDILAHERHIIDIQNDIGSTDPSLVYIEMLKRRAEMESYYNHLPSYNMDEEDYHEDYHDDEDEDLGDEDRYNNYDGNYDYEPSIVNISIEDVMNDYDRLLEIFRTTVYVCIVNYKGECEGERMLIDASHLRTFHSKYNYE